MKKFNYDDFDMFRSIKVEDICSYNSKDVDGKELENGFEVLKYSWKYDGKLYERVMSVDYDYGGSCGGSNYMWGDDYLNDENGMMFIEQQNYQQKVDVWILMNQKIMMWKMLLMI